MDTVANAIAISADCTRVAILRTDQPGGSDELLSSNIDGTREQRIAMRKHPERFAWSSTPAWSPDQRQLAVAVNGTDADGFFIDLHIINLSNGSSTALHRPRWQTVGRIAWMPNGRGLLVIGQEHTSSFQQIWYVPYPRGTPKRITNDLSDYSTVSSTADGRELVTVQAQNFTNVYVLKNAKS